MEATPRSAHGSIVAVEVREMAPNNARVEVEFSARTRRKTHTSRGEGVSRRDALKGGTYMCADNISLFALAERCENPI